MLKKLLLCFALSQVAVVLAAQPLNVVNDATQRDSTVTLRQEQPASCAMPSVGDCGSCAVSCQTGEAAICKPGKAASSQAGASCLREPSCGCQSAKKP